MIFVALIVIVAVHLGLTIALAYAAKSMMPDCHMIAYIAIAYIVALGILLLALFIFCNWLRNHAGFGA